MVSGRVTREKWVKNRVQEGDIVKDKDGRVFRVQAVLMVKDVCMELTTLEKVSR